MGVIIEDDPFNSLNNWVFYFWVILSYFFLVECIVTSDVNLEVLCSSTHACLGCCWWDLEVMSTIRWACSISRIQWWGLLLKVYQINLSFSHRSYFCSEGELICPVYHELCATVPVPVTGQCPKSCSFNGDCIDGTCHCFPGFHGHDCSRSEYMFSLGFYFLHNDIGCVFFF